MPPLEPDNTRVTASPASAAERSASSGSPAISAPRAAGPQGALTELPLKGSLNDAPWTTVVILLVISAVAVSVTTVAGPRVTIIVCAGLMILLLASRLAFGERFRITARFARRLRRVEQRQGLSDAPRFAAEAVRAVRALQPGDGVLLLLEKLVAAGHRGWAFRAGEPADRTLIAPYDVPFEPQPLSEVDSALLSGGEPSGSGALRRVHRNIRVQGGWVLVAIFGFNFAIAAWRAIEIWQVTFDLVAWGLALGAMTLVPASARTRGELLVVPGGAVWRRASWRQRDWRLHVFDRRNSNLMVVRIWRQQWGAYIHDGDQSARAIVTKAEADFLLRAWLSPLEPPTSEQLSDLA